MRHRATWMVRAGRDAHGIGEFREKGVVAVGWSQTRPLSDFGSRKAIETEMAKTHTELSPKQLLNAASQLDRFRAGLQIGDRVISYDPDRREYLLGTIASEPVFDPNVVVDLPNYRRVTWDGSVQRDRLSATSRNSLGAIQTLFRLPEECAAEIEQLARNAASNVAALPETTLVETTDAEDDLLEDLSARSHEFIKDRVNSLPWDDMERLVAGILRAMGYKTRLTTRGADRGSDIVASPDGFGFEQPRIVAEVKHRKGQMGAQEIRSFIGGRHKDDKGLYVSTGGFSKDARYEADRAGIPLTLMDLDDLVSAVVEYYEQLDGDTKAMVRLRRIYWPV